MYLAYSSLHHSGCSLCLSFSRSEDRIEPGPVVMLRNLRDDTRKEDVSCTGEKRRKDSVSADQLECD